MINCFQERERDGSACIRRHQALARAPVMNCFQFQLAPVCNGEIFEVKCVQRLAPEHLLQLACYQWLDVMEKVQEHVVGRCKLNR